MPIGEHCQAVAFLCHTWIVITGAGHAYAAAASLQSLRIQDSSLCR